MMFSTMVTQRLSADNAEEKSAFDTLALSLSVNKTKALLDFINENIAYADDEDSITSICGKLEIERFDKSKNIPLSDDIEHVCPDYSLYPKFKFAAGFMTRGCPRNCGFCVVGKKEGKYSRQVAELSEF